MSNANHNLVWMDNSAGYECSECGCFGGLEYDWPTPEYEKCVDGRADDQDRARWAGQVARMTPAQALSMARDFADVAEQLAECSAHRAPYYREAAEFFTAAAAA